jgi:hypothetical protein
MTQLFTRQGSAPTAPVQTDVKGNSFFVCPRMCNRCGGAGKSDRWIRTGLVCFDCGGVGSKGEQTVKLYTAEKLAKLNATKAKADARRAAEHQAKREVEAAATAARSAAFFERHGDLVERAKGYQDTFIRDVIDRAVQRCEMTDNQAAAVASAIDRKVAEAAARVASKHIGYVGERLSLAVTVERVASFEKPAFNAPWTTEVVNIVTMRDAGGNTIVSKGRFYAEKGAKITIKATVKEHTTYKEERQTLVQRIKEAA